MEPHQPHHDWRLLTVKQAALQLGCSPANVYSLIERGELPIVRIGRHKGYRVDVRDLDAFVNGRKVRFRSAAPQLPRQPLKHLRG